MKGVQKWLLSMLHDPQIITAVQTENKRSIAGYSVSRILTAPITHSPLIAKHVLGEAHLLSIASHHGVVTRTPTARGLYLLLIVAQQLTIVFNTIGLQTKAVFQLVCHREESL